MIRSVKLLHPSGIFAFLGSVFRRGIHIGVIIELGNRLYPQQTAIVIDEKEISYRELYHQTTRLAANLRKHYTLGKNKRVAIACRNHAGHVYALFAAALTGADVYLVHPEMGKEALQELTGRFRFDLFIYDEELNPETTNSETRFLPVDSPDKTSLQTFLRGNDLPNSRLCRTYFGKVIVLTSGSTGQAKTASRKASTTAFLSPFITLLKQLRLHQYETLYPATPFSHGFGLAALLVALVLGKRVYLLKRFDARQAGHLIDRYRIEVLTVVPSMIGRLLDVPEPSYSTLRCIITGGAMLPPALIEKTAIRLQGQYIYNLYGTSEAGFCFMATPESLTYNPQTIGKPLNGVNVRINMPEKQTSSDRNIGELCIKCNWSVRKDEWIATGDLAYQDENGYFFLAGRVDDMIISGGENVYSCELENILLTHPAITEAAVIGVPDPDFGQRLKAFIVSNDPQPDEQTLRTWLAERCARYQMPREIIFRSSLPHLPNGKINVRELRIKDQL